MLSGQLFCFSPFIHTCRSLYQERIVLPMTRGFLFWLHQYPILFTCKDVCPSFCSLHELTHIEYTLCFDQHNYNTTTMQPLKQSFFLCNSRALSSTLVVFPPLIMCGPAWTTNATALCSRNMLSSTSATRKSNPVSIQVISPLNREYNGELGCPQKKVMVKMVEMVEGRWRWWRRLRRWEGGCTVICVGRLNN